MTSLTHQLFSVFLMVLVVSSGSLAFAGTALAQENPSDQGTLECIMTERGGGGILAPLGNAYYCIAGEFNPSVYESSAELENEAYNNMISIQDTVETRQNTWENWNELSQTSALQQAEKPLIEAHYAGKDEGVARSDAQAELRNYYAAQLSTEYNTHNSVIERTVSVGSNTAKDSNTETMAYFAGRGYSDYYTNAKKFYPTADSDIGYTNITLPDGSTQSVATHVYNVSPRNTNITDAVLVFSDKNVTLKNDTTLSRGAYVWNNSSQSYTQKGSVPISLIEVRDPYSSQITEIDWIEPHSTRVSSINSEFNESQGELVNMSEDLYSEYNTGTINPSEYVSAATLTEEYASESGHYSYSSALATTNGMRTDLQSAQKIQYNGSEYEGQILVGGQGQPLADDTGAAYFSSESDSVLNWTPPENNTTGTATVTLTTASNVTVESVPDVPSDAVNISDGGTTVGLLEKPMMKHLEDRQFVLFEVNDSTGTNQTVVMYTSQDKADEGIPTGIKTGQQYSASDFQDGSVMMAYQQGDRAAVERIDSGTFTVENATNKATGEQMEYIEYDDANQRTFNSTNLKEELNQTERIQQALEQRDDINPAGTGGSGFQDTLLGALGGFTIAFGIMFFLVVLYLVGRITSVA